MPSIKAVNPDRTVRHSPTARQARRRSGLRRNSIAIFVMLLAQYGLGMGVNLYARLPAADHGAGVAAALGRALTSQPAVLAVHATLGLLMLVAGVSVLTRAILARHRRAITAAAIGLAAIAAAAASGATFVSNQQAGASMAMAVLTGVALLSYLATILAAGPPAATTRGRPMSDPILVHPIGVVSGGRSQIFEDHWGTVVSRLILDPAAVDPDATLGLEEFSHIEVVFCFHKELRARRGAAHPRGNPAWPRVGVLAGHSPARPNHLGVSRCALLDVADLVLTVRGLDAIDGTPILDIKPYTTEFEPKAEVREPAWMRELMADYY